VVPFCNLSLILVPEFQVIGLPHPDDRLGHSVDPIVVLAVGELRALSGQASRMRAVWSPQHTDAFMLCRASDLERT
jgi:hypothetical protein